MSSIALSQTLRAVHELLTVRQTHIAEDRQSIVVYGSWSQMSAGCRYPSKSHDSACFSGLTVAVPSCCSMSGMGGSFTPDLLLEVELTAQNIDDQCDY